MTTPHTQTEIEAMLCQIGIASVEQLFEEIPAKYRFPHLDLPDAKTEMEVVTDLQEIADANATTRDFTSFLGAGAYDHYIPAAVDAILRKGEFFTAYTPYQPELSQGTLQAIFEFQSLMSSLTGMDVSNASHYDGATAAAEAVIMAYSHFRGKKNKIIVSRSVNPQYRQVIRTYMQGNDAIIITGDESQSSENESETLNALIDEKTALVIVQYPDFFGRIIDHTALINAAHQKGALVCMVINPITLGLLKTPRDFDADIAVGDGQPLGMPLAYGGPYLGIFTAKQEFIRKISGRLVGETVDTDGNKAYVLTLTAREQHIRREKATSNICSNQGLMALAATVYLSTVGKHGLKQVANLCHQKAHYAADQISRIKGYSLPFKATPFFHEFVVKCPKNVGEIINDLMMEHMILPGYDLGKDYPELKNHLLIAVTEKISKDDIDHFVEALAEVNHD